MRVFNKFIPVVIRKLCSLSPSTEEGRCKDSLGEQVQVCAEQVQVCALELEHTLLLGEWLPSTENYLPQ